MQGPGKIRIEFAWEWCGVAILAAIVAVWASVIHFHLIVTWRDALVFGAAMAALFALRISGRQGLLGQGSMIMEYFAVTLAATSVFGVLSYVALASSGALVDSNLLAMDRALGFDWLAGYHFLIAHPLPAKVLRFAYDSLVYQGLYFCVLMGLMNRGREMKQMFWLVFIAGLITSAGVLLFPALGPYKIFAAGPAHNFVSEMEHIKSGQNLSFALAKMTGVVSFPSFHTTMALAYVWGFRRTGVIGWAIAAINLLMLCAIPYFGGHYLVDVIAGAGVMLASLGCVKGFERLASNAANASPECAEAYDGAY
jgi:hypothetical protein